MKLMKLKWFLPLKIFAQENFIFLTLRAITTVISSNLSFHLNPSNGFLKKTTHYTQNIENAISLNKIGLQIKILGHFIRKSVYCYE